MRRTPTCYARKILTDDEQRTLQAAFKTPGKRNARVMLALQLGLAHGLRSQETAGLRWGDIDRERKRIFLPGTITKGGKPRGWFLTVETAFLLDQYREYFPEITARTPLFPSQMGGEPITPTHLRLVLRRAFRAAGVARPGLTSHSLRHTFAVRIYKQTKDIELTRFALGHSRVSTTGIYLRGLGLDELEPEQEAELTIALSTGLRLGEAA
jgi:integrase